MHGQIWSQYSPGKWALGRRHFLDRPWKLVFGGIHDSMAHMEIETMDTKWPYKVTTGFLSTLPGTR